MSDLHPSARDLIEAAKRGERPLSGETQARVRRSVLRRVAALGVAASTTAASTPVKAGILAIALANPLVSIGAASVFVGATFAVVNAVSPTAEVPSAVVAAPARVVSPSARSTLPPVADTTPATPVAPPLAPVVPTSTAVVPVASSPVVAEVAAVPSLPIRVPVSRPPKAPVADPPPASLSDLDTTSNDEHTNSTTPSLDNQAPTEATVSVPPRIGATDPLPAQLDLLRQVHAALRGGQAERALLLLDRGASLDTGPMAEEARAARVAALCQLGRNDEARSALERLLAASPRSLLATRLREDCPALGAH